MRRVEGHDREVGLEPGQVGSLGPGGSEHARIDVDPDRVVAAAGQLDRDPSGSAARVEHAAAAAPGEQRVDQVGLAVHVRPLGRETAPAFVVVVAAGSAAGLPSRGHGRSVAPMARPCREAGIL